MMVNPRTYTHTPTVVKYGRGEVLEPLPRVFYILQYFEKNHPQWKAFELLEKMKYILWVVALPETCAVTKHGCHLGRHLGFYEVKTEIIDNFVLDV